jgi:tRNA-Thr(GGU) m(6)t(6)A37 methyltransferase TsaA
MNIPMQPIGHVCSCYQERFGIPRQPGLVTAADASLELLPPWNRAEAVRGLEDFSHLWVLFLFHASGTARPGLTVRPPRLGGNRRLGVFASRSPFRPNGIGLSAVRLLAIDRAPGRLSLRLGGADLLDGTPVLDIKPYVPYADCLPGARGGFASTPPEPHLAVTFAAAAERELAARGSAGERLRRLITQVLAQDPRPGYRRHQPDSRDHGLRLAGLEVRWRVTGGAALVTAVQPAER